MIRDKPKYVTCLAFTQTGEVLSGDSNGNIIVWTRGKKQVSGIYESKKYSLFFDTLKAHYFDNKAS